MNRYTKFIAYALFLGTIAPTTLLAVPGRAHALFGIGDIVFDPTNTAQTTLTAANTLVSAIAEPISAAANASMWVNQNVFMPLAFVMSGQLLKVMTASIVGFVAGQVNGTGAPQFVQNLQGNLQKVGDTQANAFFVRFAKNTNSPFSASITSSLRANYYQNTSLGGYFAANKDTLPKYSSNPTAFVNGAWSKGGLGAWFALTTQDTDNPYTKQPAAQAALSALVSGAQEARKTELDWAQGYLSWCGVSDTATATQQDATAAYQKCQAEGGTGDECAKVFEENNGTIRGPGTGEAGDSCTNEDGTPGTIKTPGSTIKDYLNTALGSNFRKLEGLGQLSSQVNGILGNVAQIVGTVNFAQNILGGMDGGGGLSGSIQSGPGGTSVLAQYRNSPGYLGATPQTIYQDSTNLSPAGGDKASLLSQYESAWNSINTSALAASTSVNKLIATCQAVADLQTDNENIDLAAYKAASAAQVVDARAALANSVAPVLAQASAAFKTISDARMLMVKLQTEVGSSTAYSTDLTTLMSMPPSITDVATARQQTQAFGYAGANPGGSLNVSGGTMVDRMNLLSANAPVLESSVCAASTYSKRAGRGGSDG